MYYLVFLINPSVRYNGLEFNTFETACDYIKTDIKPDARVIPRPKADYIECHRQLHSMNQ